MIELTAHPNGIILPVRARAGASHSGIRGQQNGALKVAVTKVAEKGKANQALVEALAKGLGLKRSQVELLSGQSQPQKRFLIRGLTRADLQERITAALADSE